MEMCQQGRTTGWICPRCTRSNAPFLFECPCGVKDKIDNIEKDKLWKNNSPENPELQKIIKEKLSEIHPSQRLNWKPKMLGDPVECECGIL